MQLAAGREALHRRDGVAVGLYGEHRARLDRHAVNQHRTGSAVGRVAPDMGAGEPDRLAEEVHQQQPRLDIGSVLRSVYRDRDLHIAPSPQLCPPDRAMATARARPRRTNTSTTFLLYATLTRWSSDGCAARAASCPAAANASSVGSAPARAC